MNGLRTSIVSVAVIVALSFLVAPRALGAPCAQLIQLHLATTIITSAVDVPAGSFAPEANPSSAKPEPAARVPAFCCAIGVIHPVPQSTIRFEVWLPLSASWNHRLEGVGNGAYSGRISYGALENAVRFGYAAASTDTGHSGSDLRFAVGHPERIVDWGYRAVHVTTLAAKLIIAQYYGAHAQHAYFNGCSTGGSQALSEAQRFPQDYDGILAGAAGNDRVHLNVGFLWAFAVTHPDGKLILSEDKLPLIHQAALAACHARDGVILNPLACQFDPSVLLCKGNDTSSCLTGFQVDAVRKVYAGPHDPVSGASIIAGWEPGSEVITHGGDYSGWHNFITGPTEPARLDFWKYWVFESPNWNWRNFDYSSDVAYADHKMAAVNASISDLSKFKTRGGKLLMYHGWADPVGPPGDAIQYYRRVEKKQGSDVSTQKFFRLFLVPGMSHCDGGDGYQVAGGARGVDDPEAVPKWPTQDPEHDMLSALDRWVSLDIAPSEIIAFHRDGNVVDRTIPVCPYPQIAEWKAGPPNSANSYTCTKSSR